LIEQSESINPKFQIPNPKSQIQNPKSKMEAFMPRFPIIRCALSLVVALALAESATAHQLSVFAWVEGDTVMVQASLSKSRHPKLGEVLVFDGKDQLLLKTKLLPDGTASFPLNDWETGYRIVVDIGHGHRSYWILTPYDIQQQINEGK
jgi:nickel transport protein